MLNISKFNIYVSLMPEWAVSTCLLETSQCGKTLILLNLLYSRYLRAVFHGFGVLVKHRNKHETQSSYKG